MTKDAASSLRKKDQKLSDMYFITDRTRVINVCHVFNVCDDRYFI